MYLNQTGTILSGLALAVAVGGIIRSELRRTRAERRLKSINEEVQRSKITLRSRGQLIDEIAHEVKSPLAAIISAADALLVILGGALPPDQKLSLVHLKDQSDSVFRIVTDLIEVTRLDGEIIPSTSEELALDAVAQAMLNLVKGKCMSRAITPKFQAARMPVHVRCDGRQLRQMVLNLLRIGIERCPDGGTLKIYSVTKKEEPEIASLVVEVSGTGAPTASPLNPSGPSVVELAKTYIRMVLETNGGDFKEEATLTGGHSFVLTLPAISAPEHLKTGAPSPRCSP